MHPLALKTIRQHNSKWSIARCKKYAQTFIKGIASKYPEGPENLDTYYVIPSFEHVTKNQPIIKYDPTEVEWTLDINTKFKL